MKKIVRVRLYSCVVIGMSSVRCAIFALPMLVRSRKQMRYSRQSYKHPEESVFRCRVPRCTTREKHPRCGTELTQGMRAMSIFQSSLRSCDEQCQIESCKVAELALWQTNLFLLLFFSQPSIWIVEEIRLAIGGRVRNRAVFLHVGHCEMYSD